MDRTTKLHQHILGVLRADLFQMLPNLDGAGDAILLKRLFRNYRWSKSQKKSEGIRLTLLGNQLMRKHYLCHSYDYQGSRNHRIFIALDQHMQWPYYLGRKHICFYNEQDAAWFQLNSGDIENFVNFI